ncbi:UNVERIFIED_CONTAM: hypothetical protein K2H54_044085 [Gekko kuhli]
MLQIDIERLDPGRSISVQMSELLVLLVLLPCIECKADKMECAREEIRIPHEWYQPGDFLIGGIVSQFSYHLTYGSYSPVEKSKSKSPSFYRMVPSEAHQYVGLVRLLQHFGWTWVGLFAVTDDSGEHFIHEMEPLLFQHGICAAFTERIINQGHWNTIGDAIDLFSNVYPALLDSKVKIFILYGETMTIISLTTFLYLDSSQIHGSCTGEEKLEGLSGPVFEMKMTGHSYSIYNAVYAIAYALHVMCLSCSNHRSMMGVSKIKGLQHLQPWQVVIEFISKGCTDGHK